MLIVKMVVTLYKAPFGAIYDKLNRVRNSSPPGTWRTQSCDPLNPLLLMGTTAIIPLSKGGKGGCYAISAFSAVS